MRFNIDTELPRVVDTANGHVLLLKGWAFAPGVFWPLSNETILAMAAAVRAHVQETFNRKAVLYLAIQDLSTIEAVQAFDVATQWVEYTVPVEEPEPEPEEGE
jgi:hypothetical protein